MGFTTQFGLSFFSFFIDKENKDYIINSVLSVAIEGYSFTLYER